MPLPITHLKSTTTTTIARLPVFVTSCVKASMLTKAKGGAKLSSTGFTTELWAYFARRLRPRQSENDPVNSFADNPRAQHVVPALAATRLPVFITNCNRFSRLQVWSSCWTYSFCRTRVTTGRQSEQERDWRKTHGPRLEPLTSDPRAS